MCLATSGQIFIWSSQFWAQTEHEVPMLPNDPMCFDSVLLLEGYVNFSHSGNHLTSVLLSFFKHIHKQSLYS